MNNSLVEIVPFGMLDVEWNFYGPTEWDEEELEIFAAYSEQGYDVLPALSSEQLDSLEALLYNELSSPTTSRTTPRSSPRTTAGWTGCTLAWRTDAMLGL